MRPPIMHPIPYSLLFRILQGLFSTYYLLFGSNGHFLGLTCISEEKSNFEAEDDILPAVAYLSCLQIGCVNSKSRFPKSKKQNRFIKINQTHDESCHYKT